MNLHFTKYSPPPSGSICDIQILYDGTVNRNTALCIDRGAWNVDRGGFTVRSARCAYLGITMHYP